MSKFGYARVSSESQSPDIQVARLQEVGCHPIRAEKASGKSVEGRDELSSLLDFIRPGDELVVVRLDRLGRSTRDCLNLVHALSEKDAFLTVLEPAFSTKDAAGGLLVTVLSMVAELERDFLLERQKAGIAKAKAAGTYRGRKPSVPMEKLIRLRTSGLGASAIAKELGISRMHVHRLLKAQQTL